MTFSIKIEGGTEVQVPYFDEFEYFGEVWVVHHKRQGHVNEKTWPYQVSHKGTGERLNDYRAGIQQHWPTIEEAKQAAIEFLEWHGEENTAKILYKVRNAK